METMSNLKVVQMLPPHLKKNTSFDYNTSVDVSGATEALFLIQLGVTDVDVFSTSPDQPLYIEEHDEATGVFSPVAGAALSAVLGAGDDRKTYGILVNLRKAHERWMRVNAPFAGNGTTGANLAIVCILGQIDQSTLNAAGMNLAEVIQA
jgi:hypothetical protein